MAGRKSNIEDVRVGSGGANTYGTEPVTEVGGNTAREFLKELVKCRGASLRARLEAAKILYEDERHKEKVKREKLKPLRSKKEQTQANATKSSERGRYAIPIAPSTQH